MTARLAALLDEVEVLEVVGGDAAEVEVTAVTQDSRAVVPGSLYCCIVGRVVDGHDLAHDVVRSGAGSLLVERLVATTVPQVRVASTRQTVATVAAAFWGQPSRGLSVTGITGTNGKTTTAHLLASILGVAGHATGVVGTLTGQRTTPEAPLLQAELARFAREGCDAIVMEVSSQALDQHRTDAIDFAVGVWTNLTQDHLDYHGDMASYFKAKARLFESGRCQVAVINDEDRWGRSLADRLVTPVRRYALADAGAVAEGPDGCRFTWRGQSVLLRLGGRHNVLNALAAATAAEVLGVAPADVADGLATAPPVPGRWERIDAGQPFTVVVDYAHTPDGLEQVLTAGRTAVGARGRVIVVFGCGGERDRAKRPLMAEVATRLADETVLTSDNPRREDPAAIIAEAARGAVRGATLVIEPDRATAIRDALTSATAGDVVLITGKGHETGQHIAESVLPFDDREVARSVLRATFPPGPRP
ncbi:MAG: UDP-N-acetylmuramoyl-L-alanyl-D-glutamate--2,6-diaminopimelate ligase [Acidimicrobiales bacterium]